MRKLGILLGGARARRLFGHSRSPRRANKYEIEASQLALQASSVRECPETLRTAEQTMLGQLRASGTAMSVEVIYQQQHISTHQQAIGMMQNYASGGDVPALRAVASGAIPLMQKHLAMAQALVLAPSPPPMTTPAPSESG